MSFSEKEKDDFMETVDSLKKYRRARLVDDEGNDILKYLYTDLLPNNQILKTSLKDNTTFIVGRKGTGKSTIFLKLQQEIRNRNKYLSCYIDTKTIFESSKTEYLDLDYLSEVIPEDILESYLIERTFIQNILEEIIKELNKKSEGVLESIANLFKTNKKEEVKDRLENLKERIKS